MSVGEYLSIFLAIIVGLAVTDLAMSFHKLMRARQRVRWDWISLVLALVMLLQILAVWWASFAWYRSVDGMTVGQFLPDLVTVLLLFLAVAAVLPDEVPEQGLSLRDHYLATAPYFWSLLVLMGVAVMVLVAPVHMARPSLAALLRSQWPNLVLIALMTPLIFSPRLWLHKGFVVLLGFYTLWSQLPILLR